MSHEEQALLLSSLSYGWSCNVRPDSLHWGDRQWHDVHSAGIHGGWIDGDFGRPLMMSFSGLSVKALVA